MTWDKLINSVLIQYEDAKKQLVERLLKEAEYLLCLHGYINKTSYSFNARTDLSAYDLPSGFVCMDLIHYRGVPLIGPIDEADIYYNSDNDLETGPPQAYRILNNATLQLDVYPSDGSVPVDITAFADAGGGVVTVTAVGHGRTTGDVVEIVDTTSYNGTFTVTVVDDDNFTIVTTWVANDATGKVFLQNNYAKVRYMSYPTTQTGASPVIQEKHHLTLKQYVLGMLGDKEAEVRWKEYVEEKARINKPNANIGLMKRSHRNVQFKDTGRQVWP